MSDINTVGVNLDINPALWAADRRVQHLLPPEHTLAFLNLMTHAMQLHATTGSDYTDGEFSYATALKRVEHLTVDALDAMVEADLVVGSDGDRWTVDFITPQSSHEALQNSADGKARASKTRSENFAAAKQAQSEAKAKAEHRRELDKERQRAHREKEQASPVDLDADVGTCPYCGCNEPANGAAVLGTRYCEEHAAMYTAEVAEPEPTAEPRKPVSDSSVHAPTRGRWDGPGEDAPPF